ncbi:MAG: hypothetical protein WAX38_03770 [Minisyncoccia bacterium]
MEQTTEEIYKDAFNALPKIVQDAINSSDLTGKMRKLAEKHKLHLDKWSILEDEITFALFGITPPENLVGSIQKELGISMEEAIAINNDAVEIIFEPIRLQLQEVATSRAAERTVTVPVDQQKMLAEMGESLPTGARAEVQNSKTVFQIIQERAEKKVDTTGTAPTSNNAGDSTAERHTVKEDMYRELPV